MGNGLVSGDLIRLCWGHGCLCFTERCSKWESQKNSFSVIGMVGLQRLYEMSSWEERNGRQRRGCQRQREGGMWWRWVLENQERRGRVVGVENRSPPPMELGSRCVWHPAGLILRAVRKQPQHLHETGPPDTVGATLTPGRRRLASKAKGDFSPGHESLSREGFYFTFSCSWGGSLTTSPGALMQTTPRALLWDRRCCGARC